MWQHLNTRNIRTGIGLVLGTAISINEFFIRAEPRELAALFAFGCLAGTFALLADERKK